MKLFHSPALHRCRLGLLSACLIVGGASAAQAQQDKMTLEKALQNTLSSNARLQVFPYYLRINDAELIQAQVRPAPRLGLEIANVAGSGDYSGDDQAEITLTLGQTLEMGAKRDRRIAYADAKSRQQQADYELERLDVLAETTQRYYQLLRLQSLQALVSKRVEIEQNALQVIRQRARAGASGQADVSKMQLRLAHSQALASQLQGQHTRGQIQLSAMWTQSPDFLRVMGDLSEVPPVPDVTSLREAITAAPRLLQARAGSRLAQSRLRLERANGRANLDLGVGVRRFERSNDQALVFSVSMPLYISNPNRGRVAAAQVEQELAEQQLQLSRQQLEVSLLGIQQALINHFNYSGEISNTMLPQAQQLLRDTETGYRKGRYSVLQWVDAQSELFNLQRELIETRSLIFLQFMELERLTGQPLLKRS